MNQIPALIRVFAYLSLLTVGGGMAAFPEMKVLTVDVHKWLTFPQLIHLYSVGQMAPGPNMMMIVAIGQWAGGMLGAVATLIAFFAPTAVLAFVVARGWTSWRNGHGGLPFNRDLRQFRLDSCWQAASRWRKGRSPASKPQRLPLASC